ncbi:MAG: cell division protein ZapA [Treponema sp.]|nr:cell division protein ZapA [Treponema sp.]
MAKLEINVLGTSFAIQADENPDYLNSLLQYYKGICETIRKQDGLKDPTQIAVLAGILICDELYKEKERNIRLEQKTDTKSDEITDRITKELISKIEKVL